MRRSREAIPLEIIYEDEFFIVVNKPPGMVVHPAKGHWRGTMVNALQYHFQQLLRQCLFLFHRRQNLRRHH